MCTITFAFVFTIEISNVLISSKNKLTITILLRTEKYIDLFDFEDIYSQYI